MKKTSVLSLVGVMTVGLGLLNGTIVASANSKINVVGSTALQPLAETAAKDFQKNHKGVMVDVQGGGSGTGLSQVSSGAATVGNSDLFAEQQRGIKADELQDHKVAVVGMAPVVNPKLKIDNLSMKQLQDIFTGKVTNWKEVGGPDEKVVVINRVKGSGTRATFEKAVLDGKAAKTGQEQDSNGAVQKLVANTPGAISYLAFSYTKSKQVKALTIDKVAPTAKNVANNDWKIWSYEHMYTKGKAKGDTKKFIAYVDGDKVQKGAVEKLGYISVHDMKVTKDANGKVSKN